MAGVAEGGALKPRTPQATRVALLDRWLDRRDPNPARTAKLFYACAFVEFAAAMLLLQLMPAPTDAPLRAVALPFSLMVGGVHSLVVAYDARRAHRAKLSLDEPAPSVRMW